MDCSPRWRGASPQGSAGPCQGRKGRERGPSAKVQGNLRARGRAINMQRVQIERVQVQIAQRLPPLRPRLPSHPPTLLRIRHSCVFRSVVLAEARDGSIRRRPAQLRRRLQTLRPRAVFARPSRHGARHRSTPERALRIDSPPPLHLLDRPDGDGDGAGEGGGGWRESRRVQTGRRRATPLRCLGPGDLGEDQHTNAGPLPCFPAIRGLP
mmetsp:Transcript_62315/g.148457  ORF Transcript_62315/g.148457 Transcript_62315/m.148457 type:complete len:210 (-) Transcript_62315:338-967(-)